MHNQQKAKLLPERANYMNDKKEKWFLEKKQPSPRCKNRMTTQADDKEITITQMDAKNSHYLG